MNRFVVDDDASVRVATDNLLRSLGYVVRTFASAEEFLRSAYFNDTSCVITDVRMPAMSGVDLQALLHEDFSPKYFDDLVRRCPAM